MNRIRHIAIASDDPAKAAAFFVEAFGLQQVRAVGVDPVTGVAGPGSAVGVTDGYLNLTFINFVTDQTGVGVDYRGIHHFGVQVDDMEQQQRVIEDLGAPCIVGLEAIPASAHIEIKFRGPDNVVFDITDKPWPGTK